jgi:uncharacterized protein (TIGR03435 family)
MTKSALHVALRRRAVTRALATIVSGLFCASAFGQSTSPQFDAVSVKVVEPETQATYVALEGGPGTKYPGRLSGRRVPMIYLLTKAFNVSFDQIENPKSSSSMGYDIDATFPPDTTQEQFQKMFQNMLAERFHLVVRREIRKSPGYDLVIDKGGPRFKEVASEADPSSSVRTDAAIRIGAKVCESGFPEFKGPMTMYCGNPDTGLLRSKYQERTMAEFVSTLGTNIRSSQPGNLPHGYLQPRIVDRTGLKGRYTFTLEYADASTLSSRAAPPMSANPTDESLVPLARDPGGAGTNIFAAIQKQLGLRLDKAEDIVMDYVVIENLETTPTPN